MLVVESSPIWYPNCEWTPLFKLFPISSCEKNDPLHFEPRVCC